MEKKIIVVKPKTLSPKDKAKLTKAGNIVVEHPAPGDIIYKAPVEQIEFVYTCCSYCGERCYMTKERMSALRMGKAKFYCTHGHPMSYT